MDSKTARGWNLQCRRPTAGNGRSARSWRPAAWKPTPASTGCPRHRRCGTCGRWGCRYGRRCTPQKVHGVLSQSLCVEHVQLFRHGVVAELLTVQVAGAQQVAEACVALICAVFCVVADHTPDLVRLIVAAEHGPRRHTNGTIQHDAMLHQTSRTPAVNMPRMAPPSSTRPVFIYEASPCRCTDAGHPYINSVYSNFVKKRRAEKPINLSRKPLAKGKMHPVY